MTIVTFEGLGNLGCIERGLIDPLQKLSRRQFLYHRSGYTGSPPDVEGAIVIGHSFGGEPAINYGLRNKAKLIVTIDPRKISWWPWLAAQLHPFQRPPGVAKLWNYYQKSIWLPGYEVKGADVNVLVTGRAHGDMPATPGIFDLVSSYLV